MLFNHTFKEGWNGGRIVPLRLYVDHERVSRYVSFSSRSGTARFSPIRSNTTVVYEPGSS